MKINHRGVAFVLLLIAIIAVVALKTYEDTKKSLSNQAIPNPTSAPAIPPINQNPSTRQGWTKITVPKLENFSYAEFSLEFPDTWELEGDSENFTLSKNEHLTFTMNRAAVGGGVCVFPDTETSQLNETPWQGAPVYTSYSSISTQHGTLRRALLTTNNSNNNYDDQYNHYQLCELYKGESIFEVPLDGGIIGITTPTNVTKSELNEIDTVLATYQYEK